MELYQWRVASVRAVVPLIFIIFIIIIINPNYQRLNRHIVFIFRVLQILNSFPDTRDNQDSRYNKTEFLQPRDGPCLYGSESEQAESLLTKCNSLL
jgi:hypothetical protein